MLSGVFEYFEKRSEYYVHHINRGVWRHGRGPISGRSEELGVFWSKPSIKSGDKNHVKGRHLLRGFYPHLVLVSTCKVLWSARLNTSRVTENRLEDRSSQWEAMKRSVELPTARVVDAQSPASTTVNGDCSTSHRRRLIRPVHEVGRRRSRRWSILRHLDDGWSRLKSLLRNCESAQLLA